MLERTPWTRVCGAALVAAVAWTWLTPLAAAQEPKLPPAEKILDKTIEAQGGRAAFEKHQNMVRKGSLMIEAAGQKTEASIQIYEAAPNLRYVVVFIGLQNKIESGTDGTTHWTMRTPGGIEIEEGEKRAESELRSTFNALLHWRDLYAQVETTGTETVDGQSCYKVELRPPVGQPVTFFYDRKTGLPIRVDTISKSGPAELPMSTRLEDYREVDGVQVAHKTVRTVTPPTGQPATYTTEWKSVEFNVDLPADRFELPAQVKSEAKLKDK